jgi:hypothetical protein
MYLCPSLAWRHCWAALQLPAWASLLLPPPPAAQPLLPPLPLLLLLPLPAYIGCSAYNCDTKCMCNYRAFAYAAIRTKGTYLICCAMLCT